MYNLQNVTLTYRRRGQELTALRLPSLTIGEGEYAAIVGPSGSGKTTLLSLLGGMLSPTTGHVMLDNVSLYDLSPADRAKVRRDKLGFVFQTFNLVAYLSALENVQLALYLAGVPAAEQTAQATSLLDRMGLADRLHHKPSEMSIGQQQRVALARTVANQPAIILADEPTGNLDPDSRRVVLDFFDELHREGRTIVMVTHDAVAAQRASKWLHLRDGAITPAAAALSAEAA